MNASSSNSWVLIALTILVVLLLFYLSKKMICNSYGSSNSEDSPNTTASFSTTSTTASFSDYLYGGSDYDGRNPLDLLHATGETTNCSGNSSVDTDDFEIDATGSLNAPSCRHQHHQNYHYRVDNGFANNYNINNNHTRNNLGISYSTTDGRFNLGNGSGERRVVSSVIGSPDTNNNGGMDVRGSPQTSSSTTTGSQHSPIFSPISIIAGPAFERKTMLESQLRNQIGLIIHAEREIQRLLQLLSTEQRQGFFTNSNNILNAARQSLLQHQQRFPHLYHNSQGIISPVTLALTTAPHTTSEMASSSDTTPRETAAVEPSAVNASVTTFSIPSSNNNRNPKDSIIPFVSFSQGNTSISEVRTANISNNHSNDAHHQCTTETTSSSGYHQHYLCHSPRHHHHENSAFSSHFLRHSSLPTNNREQPEQLMHSCSICTNSSSPAAGFHRQQPNCRCNLYSIRDRTRRMLMLRRLLLPISSFSVPVNANFDAGIETRAHGRDISRLPHLSEFSDLHYPQEQHVPDPLSGFSHYSDHLQRDNYHDHQQHPPTDEEDPPPYEECIRMEGNSFYHQDQYRQNLNNNISSGSSCLPDYQVEMSINTVQQRRTSF